MAYDDDLFEWNKDGRLNELTLARKSLEIDEEMKVVHFALEYVNMGNNPYEYFRSKINKAFEDEARLLDLDEGETVEYIEREDDTLYSIVGSLDEHVIPAPELEQDEEGYELCLNDSEYFKYKTNDDGTVTITGYSCEWLGNKLVIPAKLDDKEVYAVKVLEPLAGVTCVEIEQGVSEIIGAFKDWPDLNRVIMHDGLVSISEDAFVGTNITSVELPSSIMHLHDYFFKNYPVGNVGSFYPNITTLNAIYSESDIVTIIIPGTVNIVDVNAFKDCKNLTTVFIQEGTTEIKANAFTGCNSLQAIALPASLTHIDLEAIPKSVMLVGAAGTYAESFAKDNGYVYAVQ